MNLFYKGLFFIKSKKLVIEVLTYLLPQTKINEKNNNLIDEKITKLQLMYNKISWKKEPNLLKILLLIHQAQKNYFKQNYQESKKIVFKIRQQVICSSSFLTDEGKNLLLFNAELIEIKSLVDDWALIANEEYSYFYKKFFTLTEKVLKDKESIISMQDKSSLEYVSLNKSLVLSITNLLEMINEKNKGLVISKEEKEKGRQILNKINYFEDKLIKYKNNNLIFNYNILLEKIKINFYLNEEVDNNFKLMYDFCYLCISNNIEDPIYSALESFRKNKNKNNSFKDYLYSFTLEIFKSEDKKIMFKLKKLKNFVAKEEDRIKVKEVKKLEDVII